MVDILRSYARQQNVFTEHLVEGGHMFASNDNVKNRNIAFGYLKTQEAQINSHHEM